MNVIVFGYYGANAPGPPSLREPAAHLRQDEAEQVFTEPLARVTGARVLLPELDAPDFIIRAGLDEDRPLGGHERLLQVRVLRELVEAALEHDVDLVLVPDDRVEATDFAPEFLVVVRIVIWQGEYLRGDVGVAEEHRLLEHHILFHTGEPPHPVPHHRLERRVVEVGERALVAPEERERGVRVCQ